MYEERDRESLYKLQQMQKRNMQLKNGLRIVVSEYRNVRTQIDCGDQCTVGKVRHEDDLLGTSVEHMLMDEDVCSLITAGSASAACQERLLVTATPCRLIL
jgi:hypothetical protein